MKPSRKRKNRTKEVTREAAIPLGLDTSSAITEGQAAAGEVRVETREGELKGSRSHKKKIVEQRAEAGEQTSTRDLGTAQAIPATSHLTMKGQPQRIPKQTSEPLLKLLRLVGQLGLTILNIFVSGFVSVLFGFNALPSSLTAVPLIAFALHYPMIALIIFCGLMILTPLGSLLFLRLTSEANIGLLRTHIHPWSLVTATSTISFLLCFIMLITVFFRPSWCPTSLCLPMNVTNLPGVHDANLNLYFLTFQGDSVVIAGNPAHTSVNSIVNERNPTTVHAVLLKKNLASSMYRIVLVARGLYQGPYSIVIDQVALRIIDQPIIPQHLNVWTDNAFLQYDTSRYRIVYRGEGPGAVLSARYLEVPDGYTQIAMNEADQLDIQIDSHIPVALQFRMQVTYHIGPEQKRFTLQLSQVFEVVFSDQSNWYPYHLQAGHLIATR